MSLLLTDDAYQNTREHVDVAAVSCRNERIGDIYECLPLAYQFTALIVNPIIQRKRKPPVKGEH